MEKLRDCGGTRVPCVFPFSVCRRTVVLKRMDAAFEGSPGLRFRAASRWSRKSRVLAGSASTSFEVSRKFEAACLCLLIVAFKGEIGVRVETPMSESELSSSSIFITTGFCCFCFSFSLLCPGPDATGLSVSNGTVK